MLIIDKLLVSGIRWALDKVVNAVDAEMNNEDVLREELLAAQMKLELGEMSEDEFAEIEASVLRALREIQDRKRGIEGPREAFGGEGTKISSVDISFGGDEAEESEGVALGAGRDEDEGGAPVIGIDAASQILEEREESQLAIEAAGVEAPVVPPRPARARKPAKKRPQKKAKSRRA